VGCGNNRQPQTRETLPRRLLKASLWQVSWLSRPSFGLPIPRGDSDSSERRTSVGDGSGTTVAGQLPRDRRRRYTEFPFHSVRLRTGQSTTTSWKRTCGLLEYTDACAQMQEFVSAGSGTANRAGTSSPGAQYPTAAPSPRGSVAP
jgi:hypothetical protein